MIETSLTKPHSQLEYLDFAGSDLHALLASLRPKRRWHGSTSAEGWLVTSHDLAGAVMRNAQLFTVADPRFSTAHVIGPSMVSLDGPEHLRQREPFAEQLRPRKVQRVGRFGDRRDGGFADRLISPPRIRPSYEASSPRPWWPPSSSRSSG